ncbi:MAG: hypothetical protein QGH60_03435 [Phycisphaerae bacterium]|nr:hypothetical protein [Phycisphaerae bacterium]
MRTTMPQCNRREFFEVLSAGVAVAVLGAPGQLSGASPRKETGVSQSISKRIDGRMFPSVFQAWNRADNLKDEDKLTTVARHDLLFHAVGFFGLRWDHQYPGLAGQFRKETIPRALVKRKKLLEKNPNLILLAEIRYRDANKRWFPPDHKWWKRGKDGKAMLGWAEGGHLQMDFSNNAYRRQVAVQAGAAVASGVVDGVMLDWWRDDDDRLALVKLVRAAVGPEGLILANPNDRTTPRTAEFINGYFMECYRSASPAHWKKIARTLAWAEKNLRKPRINCLETWYHKSRNDLNLMRAATTLSLTHSDGYCLFSDPNPLPSGDHLHNWYAFWNKSLGKPRGPGQANGDGSTRREFDNGTVIYNPMGNKPVTVTFGKERTSLSSLKVARTHKINPCDGDILLVRPARRH